MIGWDGRCMILAQIVVADKIFILSVSFYSRNTIQYGNQYEFSFADTGHLII